MDTSDLGMAEYQLIGDAFGYSGYGANSGQPPGGATGPTAQSGLPVQASNMPSGLAGMTSQSSSQAYHQLQSQHAARGVYPQSNDPLIGHKMHSQYPNYGSSGSGGAMNPLVRGQYPTDPRYVQHGMDYNSSLNQSHLSLQSGGPSQPSLTSSAYGQQALGQYHGQRMPSRQSAPMHGMPSHYPSSYPTVASQSGYHSHSSAASDIWTSQGVPHIQQSSSYPGYPGGSVASGPSASTHPSHGSHPSHPPGVALHGPRGQNQYVSHSEYSAIHPQEQQRHYYPSSQGANASSMSGHIPSDGQSLPYPSQPFSGSASVPQSTRIPHSGMNASVPRQQYMGYNTPSSMQSQPQTQSQSSMARYPQQYPGYAQQTGYGDSSAQSRVSPYPLPPQAPQGPNSPQYRPGYTAGAASQLSALSPRRPTTTPPAGSPMPPSSQTPDRTATTGTPSQSASHQSNFPISPGANHLSSPVSGMSPGSSVPSTPSSLQQLEQMVMPHLSSVSNSSKSIPVSSNSSSNSSYYGSVSASSGSAGAPPSPQSAPNSQQRQNMYSHYSPASNMSSVPNQSQTYQYHQYQQGSAHWSGQPSNQTASSAGSSATTMTNTHSIGGVSGIPLQPQTTLPSMGQTAGQSSNSNLSHQNSPSMASNSSSPIKSDVSNSISGQFNSFGSEMNTVSASEANYSKSPFVSRTSTSSANSNSSSSSSSSQPLQSGYNVTQNANSSASFDSSMLKQAQHKQAAQTQNDTQSQKQQSQNAAANQLSSPTNIFDSIKSPSGTPRPLSDQLSSDMQTQSAQSERMPSNCNAGQTLMPSMQHQYHQMLHQQQHVHQTYPSQQMPQPYPNAYDSSLNYEMNSDMTQSSAMSSAPYGEHDSMMYESYGMDPMVPPNMNDYHRDSNVDFGPIDPYSTANFDEGYGEPPTKRKGKGRPKKDPNEPKKERKPRQPRAPRGSGRGRGRGIKANMNDRMAVMPPTGMMPPEYDNNYVMPPENMDMYAHDIYPQHMTPPQSALTQPPQPQQPAMSSLSCVAPPVPQMPLQQQTPQSPPPPPPHSPPQQQTLSQPQQLHSQPPPPSQQEQHNQQQQQQQSQQPPPQQLQSPPPSQQHMQQQSQENDSLTSPRIASPVNSLPFCSPPPEQNALIDKPQQMIEKPIEEQIVNVNEDTFLEQSSTNESEALNEPSIIAMSTEDSQHLPAPVPPEADMYTPPQLSPAPQLPTNEMIPELKSDTFDFGDEQLTSTPVKEKKKAKKRKPKKEGDDSENSETKPPKKKTKKKKKPEIIDDSKDNSQELPNDDTSSCAQQSSQATDIDDATQESSLCETSTVESNVSKSAKKEKSAKNSSKPKKPKIKNKGQKKKLPKLALKFSKNKKKRRFGSPDVSDLERTPPPSPDEADAGIQKRRSARNTKRHKYTDDIDLELSDDDDKMDGKKLTDSSGITTPVGPEGGPVVSVVANINEDTMVVEKILSSRMAQREIEVELPESTEPDPHSKPPTIEVEEYYVKYKNLSYFHCEWKTEEELEKGDRRMSQKIKRFKQKRDVMNVFDFLDEEPYNPDYIEVDRLLDVNEVEEIIEEEVTKIEDNDNKAEAVNEGTQKDSEEQTEPKQTDEESKDKTESNVENNESEKNTCENKEEKQSVHNESDENTAEEKVKPELKTRKVKHYLVKWRSLAYEDSTWELEEDLDPLKVDQFWRFKNPPPKDKWKPKKRPKASDWKKNDDSPVYKADNTLREYQLEGLNWLNFCWYNGQNCILADEMGLGKTIQSIAFVKDICDFGISGPFLIIAPLSTIGNWQREFETWTDLNVVTYHGSSASRNMLQEYEMYYKNEKNERIPGIYKFQVMITTFEIVLTDCLELREIHWRCCIIDEAHRLKNRNCKLLEGLRLLDMEHRVLLTGTPLQNNVEELFSLLNFLEPTQFTSNESFMLEFGDLKTEAQVDKLKAILKPMMLRRLKEDVEKSLAPKEETIVEVELTNVQKKYYRAILERNFQFLSKGGTYANMPNLMNTMMELRKCCIHPFLINGAEDQIMMEFRSQHGDNPETTLNSIVQASGKLVLIDKLLPRLKANGHRVLVFSQMVRCLDILEDYMVQKRYPYERIDGRVRGNLRQAAIDRFCKPDSDRFVFLLCTRAGGLGINLTAADTVIIFDSDWNPQNDLQAQARCHRIGQSKAVKVYRLICRNTYEREMFDKASLKLGLDRAVLQSMNAQKASLLDKDNQLSKKEIEDLLRKGAYGAIMDDDSAGDKFCEEDIEHILQRRTHVITIESEGKGSTFSKASFSSSNNRTDIEIDDPNFWEKWAKRANLDVDELKGRNELIVQEPRRRTQTKRFGADDSVLDMSELESSDEDDDSVSMRTRGGRMRLPKGKKGRKGRGGGYERERDEDYMQEFGPGNWTRAECYKVEKGLLTFGWGRWDECLILGNFRRRLIKADVESISRVLLLYALQNYKGDEKIKSFIWDLITPNEDGEHRVHRNHSGLSAPVPRGRKNKKLKKTVGEELESADWAKDDKYNPDVLLTDDMYRKHLHRHANKILLRVRLLYYLKHEIIGEFHDQVFTCLPARDIGFPPPVAEGDPPAQWWDEDADKSLLVGVYKHGYDRFNLMRQDPSLCFLHRCGPPDGAALLAEMNADDDLGKSLDDDADEEPETPATPATPLSESDIARNKSDNRDDESNEILQSGGFLPFPSPADMNHRLRRIVTGYQRNFKKQELKMAQKARHQQRLERLERFEAAIRERELKKREQAQKKWSRREEADFYRVVSSFGVEYKRDEDRYEWTRFRSFGRLERKLDDTLTEYFKAFYAMCKRVTGRRLTDEEENLPISVDPISEERASRCLARIDLLSKIREEILCHPELDERLQLCQHSMDLPDWWQCGKHDKDLLIGAAKYGLNRLDFNLMNDPELSFRDVLKQFEFANDKKNDSLQETKTECDSTKDAECEPNKTQSSTDVNETISDNKDEKTDGNSKNEDNKDADDSKDVKNENESEVCESDNKVISEDNIECKEEQTKTDESDVKMENIIKDEECKTDEQVTTDDAKSEAIKDEDNKDVVMKDEKESENKEIDDKKSDAGNETDSKIVPYSPSENSNDNKSDAKVTDQSTDEKMETCEETESKVEENSEQLSEEKPEKSEQIDDKEKDQINENESENKDEKEEIKEEKMETDDNTVVKSEDLSQTSGVEDNKDNSEVKTESEPQMAPEVDSTLSSLLVSQQIQQRNSLRWPKDRVLQMRLEQICHTIDKNEWPSMRHSFFSLLTGPVPSTPSVATADSSPRPLSPCSLSSASREPTPHPTPDHTPRREALSPLPDFFYTGDGVSVMNDNANRRRRRRRRRFEVEAERAKLRNLLSHTIEQQQHHMQSKQKQSSLLSNAPQFLPPLFSLPFCNLRSMRDELLADEKSASLLLSSTLQSTLQAQLAGTSAANSIGSSSASNTLSKLSSKGPPPAHQNSSARSAPTLGTLDLTGRFKNSSKLQTPPAPAHKPMPPNSDNNKSSAIDVLDLSSSSAPPKSSHTNLSKKQSSEGHSQSTPNKKGSRKAGFRIDALALNLQAKKMMEEKQTEPKIDKNDSLMTSANKRLSYFMEELNKHSSLTQSKVQPTPPAAHSGISAHSSSKSSDSLLNKTSAHSFAGLDTSKLSTSKANEASCIAEKMALIRQNLRNFIEEHPEFIAQYPSMVNMVADSAANVFNTNLSSISSIPANTELLELPEGRRRGRKPRLDPSQLDMQSLTGDENVSVINRTTGKKITGSKAPPLKHLAEWLDKNPKFDIDPKWSPLIKEKAATFKSPTSAPSTSTSSGVRTRTSDKRLSSNSGLSTTANTTSSVNSSTSNSFNSNSKRATAASLLASGYGNAFGTPSTSSGLSFPSSAALNSLGLNAQMLAGFPSSMKMFMDPLSSACTSTTTSSSTSKTTSNSSSATSTTTTSASGSAPPLFFPFGGLAGMGLANPLFGFPSFNLPGLTPNSNTLGNSFSSDKKEKDNSSDKTKNSDKTSNNSSNNSNKMKGNMNSSGLLGSSAATSALNSGALPFLYPSPNFLYNPLSLGGFSLPSSPFALAAHTSLMNGLGNLSTTAMSSLTTTNLTNSQSHSLKTKTTSSKSTKSTNSNVGGISSAPSGLSLASSLLASAGVHPSSAAAAAAIGDSDDDSLKSLMGNDDDDDLNGDFDDKDTNDYSDSEMESSKNVSKKKSSAKSSSKGVTKGKKSGNSITTSGSKVAPN